MRLTLQTDLSLRVVMYIGASGSARCTIHEIAKAYAVSENHLMKIVHRMTLLGYLETTRGRTGGIRLSPDTLSTQLGDFILKMEPDFDYVPCLQYGEDCIIKKCCILKSAIQEAHEAYIESLNRYQLSDLLSHTSKLVKALHLTQEPTLRNLVLP